MANHYDRDGKPLQLLQWAKLLEDDAYRRVALTRVGDFSISTVWIGIDGLRLPYPGNGPHEIFETMAWRISTGEFESDQERYDTESQAIAGHNRWIRKYKRRKPRDTNNACQPNK